MNKIIEKRIEPAKIKTSINFDLKIKTVRYATYEELREKTYEQIKEFTYSELKGV